MGEHQSTEGVSDPGSVRDALGGARSAVAGVREILHRVSGAELAEFMSLVDDIKVQASAAQVVIATEAAHRGEFTSARRGEGSAHEWVREHAPSLRQGGAGQLASFAADVAHATPDGQWSTTGPSAGVFADLERAEGITWARVVTGEIGIQLAQTALSEIKRLADRLNPGAIPTVAKAILDHGFEWGARDAKRIRTRLLAEHGLDGELEDMQRRLRTGAHLSQPQVCDGDVTEYRMGLTPEQSAALEAALGPLSKPIPDPQTGVFDERSNGQRRAEALMTIVTGHAARDGEDVGPAAASTALHVTIGLADLMRFLDLTGHDATGCAPGLTNAFGMQAGAGVVGGSTAAGALLNPGDVRRLACDADIIPIVLGAAGEVLDVGRAARLYTRGQRRALSHRDRGCTWPGCTSPAAWARAHHVVHWADGGHSALTNAALLCQRHHTHVHDQRLVATIHPPDEHGRSVTWDTTRGSYDRALPARLAEIRAASTRRSDLHRADARSRRLALDSGGPDPWRDADPDEDDFIAALMAEHEAATTDVVSWPDDADLFDVA
ncbi:MAG: DUF222 domain-containing protein [Knoellia sp.]